MKSNKVAMLFPGQGAWYPGVLQQAATAHPQVERVLATVDAVSRRRLGHTIADRLWRVPAPTAEALLAESPDTVQLAIFASSVALYRWLEAEGLRPDVLMGHSFGEIAALVCAGAFTVEQGAEIVCDRTEATRLETAGGYMAAIGAGVARAESLLGVIGDPATVVAGENAETQTVISGTRAGMERAAAVARALNIPFFKLNSPYPFHSPSMEPARQVFAERLRRY
jgi:acyl transferase domain-containing protein